MKSPTGQLCCDFCGKGEEACDHLIASDSFGPGCAICSKCVLECTQILIDSTGKAERHFLGHPTARGERSEQPQEPVDASGQLGVHGYLDGLSAGHIQSPAQDAAPVFGDIPSPEQCIHEIKKLFASQGNQRPGTGGKAAVGPEDVDPLGGYSRLGNGPSPWSPAYSRFNKTMLKKIPKVDKELFIIITCLQQAREELWSTYLQFAEDVERESKIDD